jgi:DNA-binding protein HU-beta
MKKADIISKIVEATNLKRAEADEAITSFLDTVKEGLKNGEKITIIGFGSFSVVERKARMGRNPQTGEEIEIPAKKTVKFNPAVKLKEEVND